MEIKTALHITNRYDRPTSQYKSELAHIKVIENKNEQYIIQTKNDFVTNCSRLLKEYTPVKGDKLFFLPGCTVPRFKMKTFCEKYKVAMVKYKDSATALFVGAETFSELTSTTPSYTYHKEDVKNYFTKYIKNTEYLKILEESTSNYVFADYDVSSIFEKKFGKPFKFEEAEEDIPYLQFINDEAYDTYISILSKGHFHMQEDVLKRINSGTVMDKEAYISIQRLFESSDVQNHKVALEIMSNCDYEKSSLYLLLLINEWNGKIWSCPTKNHVNFKSLLKFFGFKSVCAIDLDDIVDKLIDRRLLSRANLDVLMPMAIEELTEHGGYTHFTVDSIKVSDKLLKGLEDNILDGARNTEIIPSSLEEINPTI